jgi:hypothetical protein
MVQMPALNTIQFDWVKSRLRQRAQPVPPIFQPEVGAKAVYWAAHHSRREVFVGMPTVAAIEGNKIAPGLLDRYLGKTGYDSQQTSEPEDPNRPNNLWEPVSGDHGAHGRFGDRSHPRSYELWATRYRNWIAAAVCTLAGAGYFALHSRNHGRTTRRRLGLLPRRAA